MKRDDLLGPALGGNKTRKLEYLMADAQRQGAKKVATFGGLQSNHARLTAAAASLLGMEAHLLYFEPRPKGLTGNLLLNELLGARMHFFPLTSKRPRPRSLEATIRLARLLARLRVGPHYFIPVGGHTWLGALGYARAAVEIDEQATGPRPRGRRTSSWPPAPGDARRSSRGPAPLGSRLRPLGIDVGKPVEGLPVLRRAARHRGCARTSASRTPFAPPTCRSSKRTWVGEAYGRPSEAGNAALERLLRAEGILLDPVYTAKAFAGLLGETPHFAPGEPVVFLHTGGLPALFA